MPLFFVVFFTALAAGCSIFCAGSFFSAPDPAAVSPLSALVFSATPMPYWLALGGGHSIFWQAAGYGAGATALCLAAGLVLAALRDAE